MHTLIIAYGNRLRGDDGIGPAIGDVVTSWQTPGVNVMIVQQLAPEFIEAMGDAERILFVDAAVPGAIVNGYRIEKVEPARARSPFGHHKLPAELMALLRELECKTPEAWLLSIAAVSFEHGATISRQAESHMAKALDWIRSWLTEQTCMKSA